MVDLLRSKFTDDHAAGRPEQVRDGWEQMELAMERYKHALFTTDLQGRDFENLCEMMRMCRWEYLKDANDNVDLKVCLKELTVQVEDADAKRRKVIFANDELQHSARKLQSCINDARTLLQHAASTPKDVDLFSTQGAANTQTEIHNVNGISACSPTQLM